MSASVGCCADVRSGRSALVEAGLPPYPWRMLAVLGFLVVSALTWLLVAALSRGRSAVEPDIPWSLQETAGRQIVILGGMAGFAVTAIVLLVTTVRDKSGIDLDQYDTVIVLFLVAWVSLVGTAVMWTRVPRNDYEDSLLQRLHYATTNDQHYRAIVLGWMAMIPLLLAFGLERPAQVFAAVLALAAIDGAVLNLVALHRLGFVTVRDVFLVPLCAVGGAGLWAVAGDLVPGLRGSEAALYLAVAMILINGLALGFVATGPVLLTADRYRHFVSARGSLVIAADVIMSVTIVAFLWLAVLGWI